MPAATSIAAPNKDGPGEINVPVSIGGLVIHPGDIIVGDEDGVVALRPAEAAGVLEDARKKAKDEAKQLEDTLAGRLDAAGSTKRLPPRASRSAKDP